MVSNKRCRYHWNKQRLLGRCEFGLEGRNGQKASPSSLDFLFLFYFFPYFFCFCWSVLYSVEKEGMYHTPFAFHFIFFHCFFFFFLIFLLMFSFFFLFGLLLVFFPYFSSFKKKYVGIIFFHLISFFLGFVSFPSFLIFLKRIICGVHFFQKTLTFIVYF